MHSHERRGGILVSCPAGDSCLIEPYAGESSPADLKTMAHRDVKP
jgi:hypothetical protein